MEIENAIDLAVNVKSVLLGVATPLMMGVESISGIEARQSEEAASFEIHLENGTSWFCLVSPFYLTEKLEPGELDPRD